MNGTVMSVAPQRHDPAQASITCRYHDEVIGTQDGDKTWPATPLPGQVQRLFSIGYG
ncbi:hypothetical protein [Peterkaempfera sp. SMS 1(5)a]|uniref:hypothetical protein n=1 Tax=Peterkaempfera podocarpi TaxID=3232308 RepID=UPI00367144EB